MIQSTIKIEGFITVLSEKPLKLNQTVIYITAEDQLEYDDSPIIVVNESDVTTKEIVSTTDVK